MYITEVDATAHVGANFYLILSKNQADEPYLDKEGPLK